MEDEVILENLELYKLDKPLTQPLKYLLRENLFLSGLEEYNKQQDETISSKYNNLIEELKPSKKELKLRLSNWRKKNKDKVNSYNRNYFRKVNWKYCKTPKERKLRNIKRKTRSHFPIANQICEICKKSKAIEHHHTTNPIKYNKFIYLCKECHKNITNAKFSK